MRDIDELKEKVEKIIEILFKTYPDAVCSLDHTNPLELLISTILAAQCTDLRVNIVTKDLFVKYTSVYDYANCDISVLEEDIRSTGFYRNKAKNIVACCKMLIEKHNGVVPGTIEELVSLPGVGRKTANVVLGNIFGIPSIIVDTHCIRLSNRIGLTENEDPVKIEKDLMEIVPNAEWTKFSNCLVYHGRAICDAKKPKCEVCPIALYCKFYTK